MDSKTNKKPTIGKIYSIKKPVDIIITDGFLSAYQTEADITVLQLRKINQSNPFVCKLTTRIRDGSFTHIFIENMKSPYLLLFDVNQNFFIGEEIYKFICGNEIVEARKNTLLDFFDIFMEA